MLRRRLTELRWIALVSLAAWDLSGHAAGLGAIHVQSGLGQPLHASVSLLGEDAADLETHCIKVRIESTDGAFIETAQIGLARGNPATLQIASRQNINEPALSIQASIGCNTTVARNYQILLDPVVVVPAVVEVQQAKPTSKPAATAPRNLRNELPPVTAQPMPAAEPAAPAPKKRRAAKAEKKEAKQELMPAPARAPVVISQAAPMPPKAADVPPPREKVKKAARNVLRLSGEDLPAGSQSIDPKLKLADSLSITVTEADPQKLAEVRAAQAEFAALMRGENIVQSSEQRVAAINSELQTLKAQTEKLKQQRQADQAALLALKSESFSQNWIAGLGILLAVCLGAIVWLLWRFYALRKAASNSTWDKNVAALKTGSGDSRSFDTSTGLGDSVFNTAVFGETQFGENHFGDTVPIETDCDKITKSIENLPTIIDFNPASEFLFEEPAPAQGSRATQADKFSLDAGLQDKSGESMQWPGAPEPIDLYAQIGVQRSGNELALKAEEIADVMQLAELWVSLNDPKRAIQILEPLSDVERPASPAPWIYLLDLYRMTGNREKYEYVKTRFERVFNAKILAWDDDSKVSRTLEDYPHIVEAIRGRWDGLEIVPYLEGLLLNSRDGARDGFDLSVYRDIIRLISLASEPDPATRKEHMDMGQAHAILYRQRERNSEEGKVAVPHLPPEPEARPEAKADIKPEAKPDNSAVAQPPAAKAPNPPVGSAKKPGDETMGVPEMKMSGAPKADSRSFLEDLSFDAFPPLDLPTVSGAGTPSKPGREDRPRMPAASVPEGGGANEKKPQAKLNLPVFRRPAADQSAAVVTSRAGNTAAAPVQPTPVKSPASPAPVKATVAPPVQSPQPKSAAATSTAASAPTDPLVTPAIVQGEPSHGSEDLAHSLSFHVDHEDSSVMATKLQLAIAYQDIGEKDGARLLLEEVVRGGSPDQSEKARMMLAILTRGDE